MKRIFVCVLGLAVASTLYAAPVPVRDAGVTPVTDNIILNPDPLNGGDVESLGVVILSNGNILAGWEDDGAGIQAAWLMVGSKGNFVVQQPLAYANDEGQPTATNGGWGPKFDANKWGDGAIFGSAFWDFAGGDSPDNFITSLSFLGNDNDEPAMQLINNDGSFNGTLFLPYPIDFHQREGSIRVGGNGILSNGNILVVGEDRQADDGLEVFDLPNSGRVVIAGTCTPDGTPVKGPIAVQQGDSQGEIWHGVAVFDGGFAVRFSNDGIRIRYFDNDLNPLTDAIALVDIHEDLNSGGRGDGAGFHANANGDCLLVTQTGGRVVAAVFDKTGAVKVAPFDVDEPDPDFGHGADRVDGAIDEAGNFVAAWRDQSLEGLDFSSGTGIIAARFFNADGTPATPSFIVSSAPMDNLVVAEDRRPRAAIRNGIVAIVWQDDNTNLLGIEEVALRIFESPFGTSVSDWSIH